MNLFLIIPKHINFSFIPIAVFLACICFNGCSNSMETDTISNFQIDQELSADEDNSEITLDSSFHKKKKI